MQASVALGCMEHRGACGGDRDRYESAISVKSLRHVQTFFERFSTTVRLKHPVFTGLYVNLSVEQILLLL